MKLIIALPLIALFTQPLAADPPVNSYALGLGRALCEDFQKYPKWMDEGGSDWAQGFITALNNANGMERMVGSKTDLPRLKTDLTLECSLHPKQAFVYAVTQVYNEMVHQHR